MTATETSTPTGQQVGIPWRSSALVAVLAAALMTPLDVPLVSSALPEIRTAFGVSESRAGLFITLYALPGVLFGPIIGALADRLGRRSVLAASLVLFGSAGTAIAFTQQFAVALALRVLQGVAAGSVLAALAMTVVGDRYTGRQHDAVMGVTSAVLAFATALYPVVGGYLATRAWNAPFLVYALTLPVAVLVWVGLDDTVASTGGGDSGYLREALRLVPARRALALYGTMLVSFALLFGGLYTALPFYLTGAFGFSPGQVGVLTSAVLLVTAVLSLGNGRLTDRTSRAALLVAGFGLYAVALVGIALAGATPLLIGAMLVFGAGNGLVTPTLFAGVSALAPDHVRGGVMSLQTTTIGVSQVVGPAAFTALGGLVGYRIALLGGGICAAVGVGALALVALDL